VCRQLELLEQTRREFRIEGSFVVGAKPAVEHGDELLSLRGLCPLRAANAENGCDLAGPVEIVDLDVLQRACGVLGHHEHPEPAAIDRVDR
jgi:hypothetical protein